MGLFGHGEEASMAKLVNLDEPTFAEIGYIEVYDYDVANDKFNLRWKDDFNSFDD